MGLLAGNTAETKQLEAGEPSAGSSLTAEDLKELEDLDLSEIEDQLKEVQDSVPDTTQEEPSAEVKGAG